jgi:hypothetical protein
MLTAAHARWRGSEPAEMQAEPIQRGGEGARAARNDGEARGGRVKLVALGAVQGARVSREVQRPVATANGVRIAEGFDRALGRVCVCGWMARGCV